MAKIEPFPYPVPPRRGVTTGTARIINGNGYRAIWRVLALLVLLQVLDLLLTVQLLLRQ